MRKTMSLLERLNSKKTYQEIATLEGASLFKELRAIENVGERRATTHRVHYVKMQEYSKKREYRTTMAKHLVEDVHPMFREAFADVVAKSSPTNLKIPLFNRINQSLHGHHGSEDAHWFPVIRTNHPELIKEIDILETDHAVLVNLEKSINSGNYESLVEFVAFLNDHLNREEMLTVPLLMDGTGSFN